MLVLAGDAQGRDAYVNSLTEQVKRLGLADRVVLAGHVDDIAAAYATAHVTMLASVEPEAFGRAAAEALAVGCPVVTTNLGAPPETVLAEPSVHRQEITGWRCAPNAEGIAEALRAALELQPELRDAMGRRAAADMRVRFTLDRMKHATLAVYDRLLGTTLSGRFAATSSKPPEQHGT